MNKEHKEISRVCFKKVGNKWEQTFKETNEDTVNKSLLHDIVAKKMHGATYIKRITENCNYDGTRTFTVFYDNNVKNVYTIESL